MRNSKSMGLALVAAFAMSAVVASAAPAEFEAESTPVTLTGAQEGQDWFETDGTEFTCDTLTYHGTQNASPAVTIELSPAYSECSNLAGPVEVTLNGCKYLFRVTSRTSTTMSHGTTDIVCPAGKEILMKNGFSTTKCTVHIPPQNSVGGITYTSEGTGSGRYTLIHMNASGLKYSQTAGTGFASCGNALNTAGSFQIGTTKLTGEVDGGSGAVGIWVN